jgi:hypothetical protein
MNVTTFSNFQVFTGTGYETHMKASKIREPPWNYLAFYPSFLITIFNIYFAFYIVGVRAMSGAMESLPLCPVVDNIEIIKLNYVLVRGTSKTANRIMTPFFYMERTS